MKLYLIFKEGGHYPVFAFTLLEALDAADQLDAAYSDWVPPRAPASVVAVDAVPVDRT